MTTLEKIARTFLLAGAETPAYAALIAELGLLLPETDQATLQAKYRAAIPASDAAHEEAQQALAEIAARQS